MLLRSGNKIINTDFFDIFEFKEGTRTDHAGTPIDDATLIMRYSFEPDSTFHLFLGKEARAAWKALCNNSTLVSY